MASRHAYKNTQSTPLTRVEMLLALYDGALQKLSEVRTALAKQDRLAAEAALLRAQRIVLELYAGLNKDGSELTRNLAELYLFVLDRLTQSPTPDIDSAEQILTKLRASWQQIAPVAQEMEQRGEIPPVTDTHAFEASA